MNTTAQLQRRIVHSTRGSTHGPITRLMSPSDLGQHLKPFIFLDLFSVPIGSAPPRFGMHPHSGIATLTYLVHGSTGYEDATGEHGERGVLPQGGVEWMMAGGGVWHKGAPVENQHILGFQLWVAMPPALELATPYSQYLGPEQVPLVGPARVLLGQYGGAGAAVASPIPPPSPATYLAVHLAAGQAWRFEPPAGHELAWAAIAEGEVDVGAEAESDAEPGAARPTRLSGGDLVIFEDSGDAIDFRGKQATVLVVGSAKRHPHELHMGSYSVHTSRETLAQGETGIRQMGRHLRAQGRL